MEPSRRRLLKTVGVSLGSTVVAAGAASGSQDFSDGDIVETTVDLNGREGPGLHYDVVRTYPTGTTGEIMNGPETSDGYTWWGLHMLDYNEWVWCAGQYLDDGSGGGSGAQFVWPMTGQVTSTYYDERDGGSRIHAAIDIADGGGTPIYASRAGTVSLAEWLSGYGNTIIIDHENGYDTLYAHLRGYETSVGASVSEGDLIGIEGTTGNSTGPHVHLEIRQNGNNQYIPGNRGDWVEAGGGIPESYGVD